MVNENATVGNVNENAATRATIAVEMVAHTMMTNIRLILQFGSAEEKAQVLKDGMMDLTRDVNASIVIESD